MIEARNISLILRGQKILNDVNLTLRSGEVVAVLGPNGAGKSTLLRCMAGTLSPQKGEVRLAKEILADYPLKILARRRAVLSQQSAVHFPFTAMEVARMGRHPHDDLSPARNNEIADAALRQVEVWHLRHRLFPTLSGGEQQRVQLARVLAQIWERRDSYLLLDEPTSALDLKHQQQTLDLARSLSQNGIGVLCIMHDMNLAAMYADRIALMREGQIIATGAPESVLRQDMLESVFGIRTHIVLHPVTRKPTVTLEAA